MQLSFCLPFPPTVNTYWRSLVRGKRVIVTTSKKGKDYRKTSLEALQGIKGIGCKRCSVVLQLTMPDRRRRDIDNYSKGVLDAITAAGIWNDDEQVDHLTIVRGEVRKPGCVVVTIDTISDEDDRGEPNGNKCGGCTFTSHHCYEWPCIDCKNGSLNDSK